MSTRKLIQTVTVTTDEGEERKKFFLEYYVLASETQIDGAAFATYGLEVLKRSNTKHGTLRVEYRKIFDIFSKEKEAVQAALVLAKNTVTPISFRDIIEQFIGTNEFLCEEYEIAAIS